MVFTSYKFIFLFLPIVFLGYSIIRKFKAYRLSKLWLVSASLFFYSQASMEFIPFFIATIIFNYFIGGWIIKLNNERKTVKVKLLLILGLVENIGLLGYYKYSNFFLQNVNRFAHTKISLLDIALPIGISFFTFQLITYIVDCYKRDAKVYSFIDYLVFITFFPQLLVGPIVHHKEFVGQLENEENRIFVPENIMLGIFYFSLGCAKKVLIADPLINHAQTFYSNLNAGGFFESWTAVLSYTFAYYFDFSGYGDMAIGLGLLFNIKLPINFNSPYKARNFAEFWRRWNITLSQFLNDYIFKGIYKFGDRSGKLFIATFITFIVSGIWHGAGWHFIIWGIVNGVFVCFAYIMTLNSKKLPFPLAWAMTFIGIIITRVIFDSQSMTQVFHVYKSMINITGFLADKSSFITTGLQFAGNNIGTILLIVISAIISFGTRNTHEIARGFRPNWKYAAFAAILLTLSLFRMTTVTNFLYFRF